MRSMKLTITVQLADDDDLEVLREENTIRTAFIDFLEDLGERDLSFTVATEEGLVAPAPRRRRRTSPQPNGPTPDTLLQDFTALPEISPDL